MVQSVKHDFVSLAQARTYQPSRDAADCRELHARRRRTKWESFRSRL